MSFAKARLFLAALSLGIAAPPVRAQDVTAEDWRYFLKETYSQYGEPDPFDLEDQLFAEAGPKKSRERAIAGIAARLRVGPEVAEQYADLIIDSVRQRGSCQDRCGLRAGTPLYERAASLGLQEASGGLLYSVARNAAGDGAPESTADLVRLLLRHPAAGTILRGLVNYNEKPVFMAAYLATLPSSSLPDSPMVVPNLEQTDEDAGWFDALLEANEERLGETGATPAFRASLAQLALERMLRLGLTEAAVERYLRYPESLRRRLPAMPVGENGDRRDCERRGSGYRLADDLAAALWLQGHRGEARALLERANVAGEEPGTAVTLRREALLEAMAPSRAEADLFDLMFAAPAREAARRRDSKCSHMAVEGWHAALGSASPAVAELVSRRLAAAGYGDVAKALIEPDRQSEADRGDWDRLSFLFPADWETRRQRWATAIAAARARPATAPPRGSEPALRVHVAALEPWWAERPLPPGIAPAGKGEAAVATGLDLPVRPESVLRYESSGGEQALVYHSGEYDLPGEVPGFCLWFGRTEGGTWGRPLYLGLQEYFPYQVTARSGLPLLRGGTLQIEARVREIDPASITFPPVGLGFKREREGLYLEMDLARIAADRDSDGLTDIEERKLGLDFLNADSDGDGLADGVDPVPLTRAGAAPDPVRDAVAAAVVGRIFGHDSGAIPIAPAGKGKGDDIMRVLGAGSAPPAARRQTVFLIADEELFAGFTDPGRRLLLYSKADVEAVRGGKAPFYAPEILSHFQSLDGLSHYFEWSARWVGGTFLVRCDRAAACRIEERSAWIT
jgi:hypothetical protein